jgi:hypothetical protein
LFLFNNDPEGQVNAGDRVFFRLREAMHPVCLRFAFHDQQATMIQYLFNLFFCPFVLETEPACGTETQRGDCAIAFQVFLTVAVPGNAFFTRAIADISRSKISHSPSFS